VKLNHLIDKSVSEDMKKILLITLSVSYIFFISCTKNEYMTDTPANTYTPPAATPAVIKDTAPPRSFLALGDSYTIGQSVFEADRFPVQATRYLNEQGVNFNTPEIIAHTGWTTRDLLNSLAIAPPAKPAYDIVTLLIGVNNQYQQKPQQEYADEFLILLKKAIGYAGNNKNRVIVLSIPDYSVTPFASRGDKETIAKEIDAFNEINKTITLNEGVNYLDITPASRLAEYDPSLIAGDNLHPSGLEYKVWAEGLLPIIKAVVK
jgi:lysophospholipase L1-like esterase